MGRKREEKRGYYIKICTVRGKKRERERLILTISIPQQLEREKEHTKR